MIILERYSIGMGDRFAHQAAAQLRACINAANAGIIVTPVWNKSFREHTLIGSHPISVRAAAEKAVKELNWQKSFYIDADHIRLETVDAFIVCSDFFTLDVADAIGKPASVKAVDDFIACHAEFLCTTYIDGLPEPFRLDLHTFRQIVETYLTPVTEAINLYRYIAERRNPETFIVEVSMDEVDIPQSPAELLVILAALADGDVPVQTIAPRFSGRFNKGVDYIGNVDQFTQEFRADIAVINHAIRRYGLPNSLKLSLHSGSDKFAIYPAINRILSETGAGLHIKTAGTTWLEELVGLAEAGDEGLAISKLIYQQAYQRKNELCAPYGSVIQINEEHLPLPETVFQWDSTAYVNALRHTAHADYNANLRQLLHVGYKIAAEMGERYYAALVKYEKYIAKNVTQNLWERHLKAVFPVSQKPSPLDIL